MSRILVTGGAGYVGSTAVAILVERGYEVVVFDDLSMGHADAVDPRATFIEGSLLDPDALRSALAGCQAVIHFAGKSLVGESVEKPDLYHHVNVDGTANLLDAMAIHGIDRIVFSSSAATYGQPVDDPITEESVAAPTNPYGASKLAIDKMISARGISAISLRYFNVAGAYESANGWLAERHNPETHLIPLVLRATAANPLKIFGTDWDTKDGTCIRDYVHVVDLIEAHILALGALKPHVHEIVNLGSGGGYSVREVISVATKVLGRPIPVVESPRRAGDPGTLVASIVKAKSLLGWQPTRDLETMISDTVKSQVR
ncbi:MAG: UDP-glucose 4-epimerase GalE [Actinomycetes bacterium]